jgi:hypothetical protein
MIFNICKKAHNDIKVNICPSLLSTLMKADLGVFCQQKKQNGLFSQ